MIQRIFDKRLILLIVFIVFGFLMFSYIGGSWAPGRMFEELQHGPREHVKFEIQSTYSLINPRTGIVTSWTTNNPTNVFFWILPWESEYRTELEYTLNGQTEIVSSERVTQNLVREDTYEFTIVTKAWRFRDNPDWDDLEDLKDDWSYDSTLTYTIRIYNKLAIGDEFVVHTQSGTV